MACFIHYKSFQAQAIWLGGAVIDLKIGTYHVIDQLCIYFATVMRADIRHAAELENRIGGSSGIAVNDRKEVEEILKVPVPVFYLEGYIKVIHHAVKNIWDG